MPSIETHTISEGALNTVDDRDRQILAERVDRIVRGMSDPVETPEDASLAPDIELPEVLDQQTLELPGEMEPAPTAQLEQFEVNLNIFRFGQDFPDPKDRKDKPLPKDVPPIPEQVAYLEGEIRRTIRDSVMCLDSDFSTDEGRAMARSTLVELIDVSASISTDLEYFHGDLHYAPRVTSQGTVRAVESVFVAWFVGRRAQLERTKKEQRQTAYAARMNAKIGFATHRVIDAEMQKSLDRILRNETLAGLESAFDIDFDIEPAEADLIPF